VSKTAYDKGPLGYGRYGDDPEHVGCPRAKSDMSPCIARDGAVALTEPSDFGPAECVTCAGDPHGLLAELVTELSPHGVVESSPDPMTAGQAANSLRELVRRATDPNREEQS
jgi:hypothetical protein